MPIGTVATYVPFVTNNIFKCHFHCTGMEMNVTDCHINCESANDNDECSGSFVTGVECGLGMTVSGH